MTATASMPLRCWAEIDLAALERNLKLIRATLPPHIRYVSVVKADAYGHGLQQVAARLMHAGADLFAVANITEAAQVRELAVETEHVFSRHAAAEMSVAYAILVPQRRARTAAPAAEGGNRDGSGDLRPGVQRPAGEGPDDRLPAVRPARARRDQPA